MGHEAMIPATTAVVAGVAGVTVRDLLDEAQRLRQARQPFALATVVAARQPASATPGARAIVLPDGQIEGWVGGHCAQPTVVRQALEALAHATPRLLVLSPDERPAAESDADAQGVVRVPMLCAGQGELQIFVEPFLPRVTLVVVGASPVARSLAQLGTLLDFEVWVCDPEAGMESFPSADRLVPDLDALRPQLSARSVVIVATIGLYDEQAVQMALESPASYVGLIASQRRFASLSEELRARGVPEDQLSRLHRPKGLSGRALLPAEIAFSAAAELLEVRRQAMGRAIEEAVPRAEATDPICGMTVDVATTRYTADRDGQAYYFCSAGCKAAFEAGHNEN
jgi:xanthine dehydrogenase accessory factor